MSSPSLIPGSSSPGSAAAQSLLEIMTNTVGGEENWLLHEISSFNAPVKRRSFPKESFVIQHHALDDVLSLALYLHKSSPLSFNSHAISILFPRLVLRPLPNDCHGALATASLTPDDARCFARETSYLS